jgi:hypothetical protein
MVCFSKQAHLTETPRHHPLLSVYERDNASPLFCSVPLDLSRPCSGRRNFDEHLASAESTSPSRADRPPPSLPSRHRPRPVTLDTMAQPRLILLSRSPCLVCRPLQPMGVERHRLSALIKLNRSPPLIPFVASLPPLNRKEPTPRAAQVPRVLPPSRSPS